MLIWRRGWGWSGMEWSGVEWSGVGGDGRSGESGEDHSSPLCVDLFRVYISRSSGKLGHSSFIQAHNIEMAYTPAVTTNSHPLSLLAPRKTRLALPRFAIQTLPPHHWPPIVALVDRDTGTAIKPPPFPLFSCSLSPPLPSPHDAQPPPIPRYN